MSCLGLHLNNMGLCHHLNSLVSAVRHLGVIETHEVKLSSLNPLANRQAYVTAAQGVILLVSNFMIGAVSRILFHKF